ncbi:MAG: VOC family protein, partial [Myxococcota bacterium]
MSSEVTLKNAKVRTCLWFNGEGEAAAEFYVSLLPDSRIETASRPNPSQPALVSAFQRRSVSAWSSVSTEIEA